MSKWYSYEPTHLFKYAAVDSPTRMAYLREALLESRLFLAQPSLLNDPFEGRNVPDFEATASTVEGFWRARKDRVGATSPGAFESRLRELLAQHDSPEMRRLFEQEMRDTLAGSGVYCMSSTPTSVPMWSYYADSHSGVCLRFRVTTDFVRWAFAGQKLFFQVRYSRDYPHIKFYEDDEDERLPRLFMTKAVEWEHEAEWRIVGYRHHGHVAMPPEFLDGVVLGARMSPSSRAEVLRFVGSRASPTEVLQARIEARSYALVLDEVAPMSG